MPDRVLDQGLQQQRRHARGACLDAGIDREHKPLPHPDVQQAKVRRHHRQFGIQRGVRSAQLRQARTQVVGKRFEHLTSARRIVRQQRLDRGQGVEQEMRLYLPMQQAQLRFGRLRLQGMALQAQTPEDAMNNSQERQKLQKADLAPQYRRTGQFAAWVDHRQHAAADQIAGHDADNQHGADCHGCAPVAHRRERGQAFCGQQPLDSAHQRQHRPGDRLEQQEYANHQTPHEIGIARLDGQHVGQAEQTQRRPGQRGQAAGDRRTHPPWPGVVLAQGPECVPGRLDGCGDVHDARS